MKWSAPTAATLVATRHGLQSDGKHHFLPVFTVATITGFVTLFMIKAATESQWITKWRGNLVKNAEAENQPPRFLCHTQCMSNPLRETRLSAVERLAEALRERIVRGDYAAGKWLPTERELAAEFRADRSTIRAALSSLAERELIKREPGHRPRVGTGEAVLTAQTPPVILQTLAIVSPQTPHYPASPAVQRGVLHTLRQTEAPFHLLVLENGGDTRQETYTRERQALEAVRRDGIQGVILWHQGNTETLADVRRLQETGIPIVLVDRYSPTLACDFVGIDNGEAACEAVTYLLDLGHWRVGHLTMEDATTSVSDREQGYREALASRGIRPASEWVVRLSHRESLQPPVTAAVDHFLSLAEPVTAVFAMNDLLAHALLSELQGRNIAVPEQISVMGFDDMDRNSPRPSPMTTVHQPFEQMGRKAMELLLKRLAMPGEVSTAFQHILLPTRLVVRSSCAPPMPR